ncbi:MAG: methyltransferase domain-containing protein [Desulfomonilia bacterium]|nr:methyltransferase domain-containing protein [Desulfomonilia bacterium]
MIQERYGAIAQTGQGCCSPGCGLPGSEGEIVQIGQICDYTPEDLGSGSGSANLGLGCGNPVVMADLKPGEVVLDLGSGPGFDAFLAARAVGESGCVIGIDMTPEMIALARSNADRLGFSSVEFRPGEIENLPVEDDSVDVVLSNCVINLSTDKGAVYREIFRTLKPGGRICISDVLRSRELPEEILNDPAMHAG